MDGEEGGGNLRGPGIGPGVGGGWKYPSYDTNIFITCSYSISSHPPIIPVPPQSFGDVQFRVKTVLESDPSPWEVVIFSRHPPVSETSRVRDIVIGLGSRRLGRNPSVQSVPGHSVSSRTCVDVTYTRVSPLWKGVPESFGMPDQTPSCHLSVYPPITAGTVEVCTG